jgi:hypothetical protein
MQEVVIYSKTRYRPKIHGWRIVRKTKIKDKIWGRLYGTEYRSRNHIQEFLDYIFLTPRHAANVVRCHQLNGKDKGDDPDDPTIWKYGIVILSREPFNEDFKKWEMVAGAKKTDIGLYRTVYRSRKPRWGKLIEHVRSDKRLNKLIKYIIPEINTCMTQKVKFNRAIFRRLDKLKRHNVTVSKGGGLRKVKYEYPSNCVSKEDRSKYRRDLRRKQRKGAK